MADGDQDDHFFRAEQVCPQEDADSLIHTPMPAGKPLIPGLGKDKQRRMTMFDQKMGLLEQGIMKQVNVVKEVINTEKERKKELKKAIEKCLKEKVFSQDEDELEQIMEECTTEELKNINAANFVVGYKKNDVSDKLDFVNKLPLEYKLQLIEEIEQKQIPKMNKENQTRMTQFLEAWKKSENSGGSDYYSESLLYPIAFNPNMETQQQRTAREQAQHELRILSMESDLEINEDEWFIETIKSIPKPKGKEHDYIQFDRYMSKNTQSKLIDIPIMPSKYLNELKKKITGVACDVLEIIHFHEPQESSDKIYSMIIQLFQLNNQSTATKHKDNNLEVFQKLQKMPEAQRAMAKWLVDPNLFNDSDETRPRLTGWTKVLKSTESCYNMANMMATFDKKTQQLFYENFSNAMHKLDYIQPEITYYPELITLKEKESIKEVKVTERNNLQEYDKRKRFWITDYPLLSYLQQDSRNIIMAHLADPEAPKKKFQIDGDEHFMAYVDKYPEQRNASVDVLLWRADQNQLIYRKYIYNNPFEKKDFTDEKNWEVEDETIQLGKDKMLMKEHLDNQRKVCLVNRGVCNRQDYTGLLIQTNESLYFFEIESPDVCINLIEDQFSVKLEVLRGLSDHFYYALRDDGAASDALFVIKFQIDDESCKMTFKNEPISAAITGEILAFEMDPLNTNDIESHYHDNDNLEEWEDKIDRIFLIDGRLNLFKFQIERECRQLEKCNLFKFKNIGYEIETQVRDKDFIRICATDRCLTINGKTSNYRTGFQWDFASNFTESQYDAILFSESIPFTNLQIALMYQNNKKAFLVKNEPSSRKKITFGQHQRDILLFEMINENLFLAKLQSQDEDQTYWTLMDIKGNIQEIPEKMKDLLEKADWTQIQSKRVDTQEDGIMPDGRQVAKDGYLIALTGFDKKADGAIKKQFSQQPSFQHSTLARSGVKSKAIIPTLKLNKAKSVQMNPFPEIGGILLDVEKRKVLCTHYRSNEDTMRNIEAKDIQELMKKQVQFKTLVSENNEIYVIYSNPQKNKNKSQLYLDKIKYENEGDSEREFFPYSIPIYVVETQKIYYKFFKLLEPALLIDDCIFLKNADNDILKIHKEDNEFLIIYDHKNPKAPPGDCILSKSNEFFTCRPAEAERKNIGEGPDDERYDLICPRKLQISYANKAVLCEVSQLSQLDQQNQATENTDVDQEGGQEETYHGINFLLNAEKYVDSDISLSQMKIETKKTDSEEFNIKIWTHVNSNVSKDLYYVYQDWQWKRLKSQQEKTSRVNMSKEEKKDLDDAYENKDQRQYSFMGLYRKFSECDFFELMHLIQKYKEGKEVREVEFTTLFALFYGNSIFQLFYKQVKVLKRIIEQLEMSEFKMEQDDDDTQLENQTLRRLYFILSNHQKHQPKQIMLTLETGSGLKKRENKEKGFWETLKKKGVNSALQKLQSAPDDSGLETCNVNCNSLLYKIQYSDQLKSRDMVLEIASYCERFSLQNFFISLDDVKSLLQHPSPEVIKAFDNILIETPYTKQIVTLDIASEEKLIAFWHKQYRMQQDTCNEEVRKEMEEQDIGEEEIMMNSVSVKMLEIKWLKEGDKTFLDLIDILNEQKNETIFRTKFVSALLLGYWIKYYRRILWSQFIPFLAYMFGIMMFLMYALQDNVEKTMFFDVFYYPLYGYVLIFMCNQALCEYTQWLTSESNGDYFLDFWNMNDLTYLILNLVVMFMNLVDHDGTLEKQRTLASVSVCFLWFKVFDWLRLFDGTAFFIKLIEETLTSIRAFLIIMVVWYMMFGSAIYILDMSLPAEQSIMPEVSNLWVLDAFQNQYELSLGEYQLESYEEAESRRLMLYVLFFASTFLIQIMFLNMLIAIMGDAFDQATENRENNATITKVRIMGDYIDLIARDDDSDEEEEGKESQTQSNYLDTQERGSNFGFDDGIRTPRSPSKVNRGSITEPVEADKKKKMEILYVVEPLVEGTGDQATWEGHLSALKRFTEKAVLKTENSLMRRVDKVYERVIEAEGRDATSEREMKTGLSTLMAEVKKQIETLAHRQDEQHAELQRKQAAEFDAGMLWSQATLQAGMGSLKDEIREMLRGSSNLQGEGSVEVPF